MFITVRAFIYVNTGNISLHAENNFAFDTYLWLMVNVLTNCWCFCGSPPEIHWNHWWPQASYPHAASAFSVACGPESCRSKNPHWLTWGVWWLDAAWHRTYLSMNQGIDLKASSPWHQLTLWTWLRALSKSLPESNRNNIPSSRNCWNLASRAKLLLQFQTSVATTVPPVL